jgi:hypothetical protein
MRRAVREVGVCVEGEGEKEEKRFFIATRGTKAWVAWERRRQTTTVPEARWVRTLDGCLIVCRS